MTLQDELDQKFLDAAYEEAQLGLSEGGIPIGSVLVRNGEIIGRAIIAASRRAIRSCMAKWMPSRMPVARRPTGTLPATPRSAPV